MIAEAIQRLEALVRSSISPVVALKDDREVLLAVNGEITRHTKNPDPRKHRFASVEAFATFLLSSSDLTEVAVFINDGGAVACLDFNGMRLERAFLPLVTDPRFDFLLRWEIDRGWVDQKELVRALRIELRGTLPPAHLLEKVRRVKFTSEGATAATVMRDRESLGREIASRVESAEGEIPESVSFLVPRFLSLVEWAPAVSNVLALVEVDSARGMFRVIPDPIDLDTSTRWALGNFEDDLRDRLDGKIPVYRGSL